MQLRVNVRLFTRWTGHAQLRRGCVKLSKERAIQNRILNDTAALDASSFISPYAWERSRPTIRQALNRPCRSLQNLMQCMCMATRGSIQVICIKRAWHAAALMQDKAQT
jgi:hypothetical protein